MIHFGPSADTRVGDQVLLLPPKPPIWRCFYPGCKHRVRARRGPEIVNGTVEHLLWHGVLDALKNNESIEGVRIIGGVK